MEKIFSTPVTSISCHPTKFDVIALGYMDGLVRCCVFDVTKKKLQSVWSSRFKRSIRALEFSEDGHFLYVICANRAACVYDVETGKRMRCIRKAHEDKPTKICVLPNADIVTGAEDGEIRIWDFRKDNPIVSTLKDQDDIVNAFGVFKNSVLVASGDCTVATYDYRQRKMRLKSEKMHSELLSIAVGDRLTYVGAADGHIEIFNNGEYGNILERLETPFPMGVDSMIMLHSQLLLTGSSMGDELRFFHLSPNKKLHCLEQFGGVDVLTKTKDDFFLLSISCDSSSLRIRALPELIEKIPMLKAQDIHELKKRSKATSSNKSSIHNFYKDLLPDDLEENEDDQDADEEITDSEHSISEEEKSEGE